VSVAYSPDGRHITSGSWDNTIRIWNAETGSAIGKPLKGHNDCVQSAVYSSDGRYIISGSDDMTIRIWSAETGVAVAKTPEGHTHSVASIAYSPDEGHIAPGSSDRAIHGGLISTHSYPSTSSTIQAGRPDPEGWVRDSVGGLLYWVPQDCRAGLHSPALLTIPLTSPIRSVSLQFEEFVFGTSWTQIFNTANP
jgi:WD40 repeat protein